MGCCHEKGGLDNHFSYAEEQGGKNTPYFAFFGEMQNLTRKESHTLLWMLLHLIKS